MSKATVTIKTTIIRPPPPSLLVEVLALGCYSFCCVGEPRKVVEVSHDANVPLTVTELLKSGKPKGSFSVGPGQVHRLDFDEKTLEQVQAVISSWSMEFDDGRSHSVSRRTENIREDEPQAQAYRPQR